MEHWALWMKKGSKENAKGVSPICEFLSTKRGKGIGNQKFHFNINSFQPPKSIRRLKYILSLPENYT